MAKSGGVKIPWLILVLIVGIISGVFIIQNGTGFAPYAAQKVYSSPRPTCVPRPSCLDEKPSCRRPVPKSGWCKKTPKPKSTCVPRPSCLDETPRCAMPVPKSGWCPNSY